MEAPRDDLIRMYKPGQPEFRVAEGDDDDDSLGLMTGHFAVFDEWTVIDSWWEGKFKERITPGAFAKTIREKSDAIKVLFDHGFDRSVGNKVLGPIDELSEDDTGPYYEVPLLDTSYNRDLVPGLRKGLYGASFRFRVIKDEWVEPDEDSGDLRERTIREVELYEFGPVTFPAYQAATAGLRSLRDFDLWRSLDDEGRSEFLRLFRKAQPVGTPIPGAATSASAEPGSPHSPSRAELEQSARQTRNLLIPIKERTP